MEIGNNEKKVEGGQRSSNLESVLEDVEIKSSTGFENRKKKIIILGFIIILAVGVGIFYWANRDIKGSPDDYVIIPASNGQVAVIENKRAGLKVRAPEGWDIEKIELLEGSVAFDSPDIEGEWRNNMVSPPLTKGCGIEGTVIYEKIDFNGIKEKVKDIHFGLGMISEEFEEKKMNNRTALKNTFDSQGLGPGMAVYFIENKKVYSFCVYWAYDDEQRCIKEFEEMLDRVEIE